MQVLIKENKSVGYLSPNDIGFLIKDYLLSLDVQSFNAAWSPFRVC